MKRPSTVTWKDKSDEAKTESEANKAIGDAAAGSQTRINEPNRAKKRWQGILGKLAAENALTAEHDDKPHEGLIEEIKRAKQRSKVKESVLSVLKAQADLTQKLFERQKFSAKEILIRKRAANSKGISGLEHRSRTNAEVEIIAEYNRKAQLRYRITPEIQEKLDKIKADKEAAEEKRKASEEEGKPGFFARLFSTSIIGQTLRANPRFYKMNPHEHLPELCRRCRRPLVDSLESRFTSVGILFCFFLPIIGILLLFANREFVCVICDEVYVYGDLTARPEEENDDEDVEEHPKN